MESILQIEYEPSDVDDYPVPVKVEVELFDPADVEIPPDEFRAKPGKKKAAAVSNKIVRQAAFSSELVLTMRIHLLWPRRSENKPTARIRRVSLEWPTITSLSPSSLRFSLGEQAVDVQYNPQAGSLEWVDVPIDEQVETESDAAESSDGSDGGDGSDGSDTASKKKRQNADPALPQGSEKDGNRSSRKYGRVLQPEPRETNTSGDDARASHDLDDPTEDDAADADEADLGDNDVWRLCSNKMQLYIEQPGQLRSESLLRGQMEVEVESELLSGLDARLFDALGHRQARGTLSLQTTLTVDFSVVLEDEFNRRFMSATHTLHFDEVVPDNARIDDINAALREGAKRHHARARCPRSPLYHSASGRDAGLAPFH
jgi:hypothetical protein